MNSPTLVCVTGPDGAGKTTQVTRLAERLARRADRKVAVVTIWDLLLNPKTAPKVAFRSPQQVDAYLRILSPLSRALYLYHCFNEAMVYALDTRPDLLILNSYWYKYYATEVAHGANADQILTIADATFREPDITFYLTLSPEQAFDRKAQLSGYETGFAEPRSKDAFVAFQRKAHEALEKEAQRRSFHRLDGSETADALTDRILGAIQ